MDTICALLPGLELVRGSVFFLQEHVQRVEEEKAFFLADHQ